MHFIGVPLSRTSVAGMHLVGVHLIGMYLIGMHLVGVQFTGSISQVASHRQHLTGSIS